jgi:hypothetical protein
MFGAFLLVHSGKGSAFSRHSIRPAKPTYLDHKGAQAEAMTWPSPIPKNDKPASC